MEEVPDNPYKSPFSAIYDQIEKEMLARYEAPGSLFHYTSSEGLLGILGSHTLRFANAAYMNDGSESVYGVSAAKHVIEDFMEDKPDNEKAVAASLIDAIAAGMQFLQPIVFCLSEDGNLLNQWRDYGRDVQPYCIEFDIERLIAWQDYTFPVFLTPVIYNTDRQVELLKQLTLEVYSAIKAIEARRAISDEEAEKLSQQAAAQYCMLICRFKNFAFEAEREWRLIVFEDDIKAEVKFRGSSLGVVPFYEYHRTTEEKQLPVRRVIVGPNPYGQVAELALKTFLKAKGYDAATNFSTIPIRR